MDTMTDIASAGLPILRDYNPQGLFTQLFFSITKGEGWSTAN